ncbi:MAG TPA: membrane protein insertase YidC [Gemmatimonadales bacterium]|jgi:YidC/Oxa1 family membrane protein insertase|nr:membrane protein insertase YidC [Gemmatimonadales bacterium]
MDRRVLLAILLMMAVMVGPALFFKRPPPRVGVTVGRTDSARVSPAARPADTLAARPALAAAPPLDSTIAQLREDTILVTSSLYRYGFSTRGGRLIEATLFKYNSMRPEDRGQPAQLLLPGSELLQLSLLIGADTVSLRDWQFTPSAPSLNITEPTPLSFTAQRGELTVFLNYTFRPDNYLVDVTGRLTGIGPNGATLLLGMGPGLRNTESDSVEHQRELSVVVKNGKASLTRFMALSHKAGDLWEPRRMAFNGPFEWVAVKSKYFVTAVLALDTTGIEGRRGGGGISGASAIGAERVKAPTRATISAGLPVPAAGAFRFQLYAGPLEYPRLRAIGHDFDDVNPYGWPGLRTIIRPVALGARSLLVWFHDGLGLAYGVGLILFGIAIRIVLWPLNQKAMRSSMALQAVQPLMKELQEKHKGDPQRLQQEMFKLYKEHNVNPLGGCWPMLLPIPILFAFFFVFQNTIELRGASFLWLPDLSRADPTYIIPILMGLSMFALSWIGQRGMPPNPQTKMMLYLMPGMMTFLFLRFASGLNLYYTVMNLASLPQQWLLSRERLRRNPAPPPVPAKPKPLPGKR